MNISYKKLWKLLIDRDMKKKDLEKAAGKMCIRDRAYPATRRFCAATFGRCVSGLMVAGIMVTLGIVLAPL